MLVMELNFEPDEGKLGYYPVVIYKSEKAVPRYPRNRKEGARNL